MDNVTPDLMHELEAAAGARWTASRVRGQPAAPPVRWISVASLKPIAAGPAFDIGLTEHGRWVVEAGDGSVADVEATGEYLPLFPLLEMSFDDARQRLEEQFSSRGLTGKWLLRFPFESVVAAALTTRSKFWPSLALKWVDKLGPSDAVCAALDLVQQMGLTQQQRHQAGRVLSAWRRQPKT